MQIPYRTVQQIVQDAAANIQAQCPALSDFEQGSVLYAMLESSALQSSWNQYQTSLVWTMARLSTSTGSDIDSFINTFRMTREPATYATGAVTVGSSGTISQTIIPAGTQFKTGDGGLIFVVYQDTSNANWSTTLGGYILPGGTGMAVSVPVACATAGSVGNVAANTITLVASGVAGVSTVTNPLAFATGEDAETDAAVIARFPIYLKTLTAGTLGACAAAIISTQQGLSFEIAENYPVLMTHTITVDDGSGAPSATLLSNVWAACDAVRPMGSTIIVQGPQVSLVVLSLTLSVLSGCDFDTVAEAVSVALTDYVEMLGIGVGLRYLRAAQVALNVEGVDEIANLLVNGGTADVSVGSMAVLRLSGSPAVDAP